MTFYELAKSKLIKGLIVSKPDGYNGERVQFQFAIIENRLIEVYSFGSFICPIYPIVHDEKELRWLLNNSPKFKDYKIVSI